MKDYRVCFKVKNNYLLKKMEDNGIYTASELARQAEVSPTEVCNFINLKRSMCTIGGEAREAVKRISEVLNCLPEDLFPKQHHYLGLEHNTAQVEIDFQEVQQLFAPETNPETLLIGNENFIELQSIMERVLPTRTVKIINKRLEGNSCREIGEMYGISFTRVQQLESKGLRKLSNFLSEKGGYKDTVCDHRFKVSGVHSSSDQKIILVVCSKCHISGHISTFTKEEWYSAFKSRYKWNDNSRVIIQKGVIK